MRETSTVVRINKTWLKLSEPNQRVKNRLKKRLNDRFRFYMIDYPKYENNEEGS